MADVFDIGKRSNVMSRIRGTGNKTTEVALAAALREAGITGWRRHIRLKIQSRSGSPARLVVKPDFLFRQCKLAVFVDGCFWHQCPLHSKLPENNRVFWTKKLVGNVERDRQATRGLIKAGWVVLRLWEHELQDPTRVARKVERRLKMATRIGNVVRGGRIVKNK